MTRRLPELETAKESVKAEYADIVTAQKKGLGDLFDAEDYPPADDYLATFRIESRWIQIGVPPELENVNSDLFVLEVRKQKQDIENAADDVRALLRTEFMTIMQCFRGMISGEQKTQFNAKTAKRLAEFREAFAFRDLTDDGDLKAVMDDMADVVSGLDAKSLRSNENLRTAFQAATRDVLAESENLIEDAPVRRFSRSRSGA